ncbi:MAG: imidazoleglycerol-phosphate dehydratase [Candidatus Bathyarchaeia archaeon]
MSGDGERRAKVERRTLEVSISGELNIDGSGRARVSTGVPFFDHMLATLAKHALFDLELVARGDLEHHLIEEVGIALGSALDAALGDRRGIRRFGSALIPMDESLASAAVDLSGRGSAHLNLGLRCDAIEGLKVEWLEHFLRSLAAASRSTIHVNLVYGMDEHHKAESSIKALARALREAIGREPRAPEEVPSVKGGL